MPAKRLPHMSFDPIRVQAELVDLRHRLSMHQHFHRERALGGHLEGTPRQGAHPQADPWLHDIAASAAIPPEEVAHVYLVHDGGTHWYIAESNEDALARHSLHLSALEGLGLPDGIEKEFGPFRIHRVPDDEVLSIILDPVIPDSPELSRTCEEWIRLARLGEVRVNRYGLLSTTNF